MVANMQSELGASMSDEVKLLTHLYDRFNARDIESVLAALDPNVVWANGMEGGHVHTRDGVRGYWLRQWETLNPRVEPVGFSNSSGGGIVVEVHQVVHDIDGNLLADRMVGHEFQIENGLVQRFDIRP
jgi:hypothetical protein